MSFRSHLRPVKRQAAILLQHVWSAAFRCARYGRGHPASALEARGGERIVIVAPHPDDEAIGCAGAAMLHADAGDQVCLVIATDGRRSTFIADPRRMALQRKREAEHAARLMKVTRLAWIGLPEGEWSLPELTQALRSLLREVNPTVVYAPSRLDFHPEHLKVAHALALALETLGARQPVVRIYAIQVPLTALLANVVADVSALYLRCDAVLRAYGSQAGSVQCAYRQRRYTAQRHGIALQAEEFWELPIAQYIKLHRSLLTYHPRLFRGLRNFPLTDPLAYLVGRRARRAMRAHGLQA